MSGMEIASYMMTVVYVMSFLAMSAILAKEAGRPIWLFDKGAEKQALPAMLFRLAFIGAVIWPLVLALVGNPIKADPLSLALDGPWLDVLGHLLVDLDLDFVVTSERLWGTHATVPSLAIYEALRNPAERGIAQYEHRWDGRQLTAVGARA